MVFGCHLHSQHDSHLWHPSFFRRLFLSHSRGISLESGRHRYDVVSQHFSVWVNAPIAGGLADRWRPRVLIFVGVIMLGVSTAGCALATRLWHFYFLSGFLMSIGTAFSGWPIFAPALMNWFAKRRGLVLGLGQMGGGLSFAYSIIVEFFIRCLGWRTSWEILTGPVPASTIDLVSKNSHELPLELPQEHASFLSVFFGTQHLRSSSIQGCTIKMQD